MDKFIEVYEFFVEYATHEIKLKEIALSSFYKIANIYMVEFKNG